MLPSEGLKVKVFNQSDYLNVVKQACKDRGFKQPTPHDLLVNSIFGGDVNVQKYISLLKEIDQELLNQGFTHINSTEGVLNQIGDK